MPHAGERLDAGWLLSALKPWGRPVEVVNRVVGGWNSTTWLVRVTSGEDRGEYVAKLADANDDEAFRSGLRVAARAAAHGFPSGPPLPTADGRLAVDVTEGTLALLKFVPGRSPDESSAAEMFRVGRALAGAHAALGDDTSGLGKQFTWPWEWAVGCLRDIPMPPEVRAAAVGVLDDAQTVAERGPTRIGVVHGDPGPDSFRLSETSPELDGLIDWSATMEAPLLYDLASFGVLTRKDPQALRQCLDGYLDIAPERAPELAYLGTFTRLRWMCNAIYFSARIARGIVRGAESAAENEAQLAAACRGMTE